jgi:hypothetical protein
MPHTSPRLTAACGSVRARCAWALCLPHCASLCVSLTVRLSVSPSLCVSLCLPHCASLCVSLTVPLSVSPSLCVFLCLPHCASLCARPHALPTSRAASKAASGRPRTQYLQAQLAISHGNPNSQLPKRIQPRLLQNNECAQGGGGGWAGGARGRGGGRGLRAGRGHRGKAGAAGALRPLLAARVRPLCV